MGQSGIANIAVGFEWTPFSHGFVFWEYPGPDHLPPSDETRRMLPGNPHLPALLALIKLGHARLEHLAANRPANSA